MAQTWHGNPSNWVENFWGVWGKGSLEDCPDDKARDIGNLNTTTQSSGSLASWTRIGDNIKSISSPRLCVIRDTQAHWRQFIVLFSTSINASTSQLWLPPTLSSLQSSRQRARS